jgi:hypothetical protein
MALLEEVLELRLALARSRKLREAKGKYPAVDLSHLTTALEKIDKELEHAQDKAGPGLAARAKAGDGNAEMFKDALAQTRELLLDLLKMADDFED